MKRKLPIRADRVVWKRLWAKGHCLQRTSNVGRFALAILFVTFALLCVGDRTTTQPAFAQQPDGIEEQPSDDDRVAKDFPGSASLDSDTEIDRHLLQADAFLDKGLYEDAVKTWKEILLKAGSVVSEKTTWMHKTFEQQKYAHHATAAERIRLSVGELPPQAFQLFRETVDPDVTALLFASRGASNEQTLEDIVHRYFHTTQGDDAAFELAALRFDRGDFGAASRLLQMILDEYREPSVSRERLLLRLAVANARMGDERLAVKLFAQAKDVPGRRLDPALLVRVEAEIQRSARQFSASGSPRSQWRLAWGGASRDGHMQPVPGWAAGTLLTESWTASFDLGIPASTSSASAAAPSANVNVRRIGFGPRGRLGRASGSVPAGTLTDNWKQFGWMPTSKLLLSNGRVYFKGHERLICCDARDGRVRWLGRRNRFKPDYLSQQFGNKGTTTTTLRRPKTSSEIQRFGDRIHQEMSVVDDNVYSLEGELINWDGSSNVPSSTQNGRPDRRSKPNWLSAYDATNGKLKWHRSASDVGPPEDSLDIGFLAAPVPQGDSLLIPVANNGELWLYALQKNDGQTLWKVYLCDDPERSCSPWSPVGIAVSGADAYVASGAGIVFAIAAETGRIRWAVRYQRAGKRSPSGNQRRSPTQMLLELEGWKQDVVIPVGSRLIVAASDSNRLFALDRRTGRLAWDSPRTPSTDDAAGDEVLGVLGQGLFVAGNRVVRRYDVPSGRIAWEAPLDGSLGRGMITTNALFVPEQASIVELDPETGATRNRFEVLSPKREPVGNLFSDGEQLLVVAPGRLYAVTELNRRLAQLATRITADDNDARIDRMRLRHRMGQLDDAIADLIAASASLLKQTSAAESRRVFYDSLIELSLADVRPQQTLQLIAIVERAADETSGLIDFDVSEALDDSRSRVLVIAFQAIRSQKVSGAGAAILGAAAYCIEDYLATAARHALAVTVQPDDGPLLREAVRSAQSQTRLVAASVLVAVLKEEAQPELERLLDDSSDGVRLVAAVALVNLGEKETLVTFGRLLDSEQLAVRTRSAQVLRHLTGQSFQFAAYTEKENRADAAKRWQNWIATSATTVELKLPIRDEMLLRGHTLIGLTTGEVIELAPDGKQMWQQKIPSPYGCHGLPNGNRLVASQSGRKVVEFDAKGNEIWSVSGTASLPGRPFSVRSLANGNILVACSDGNQVVEISRDRKVVWRTTIQSRPMDARRLPNGNTLIAVHNTHQVVEVDPAGKVVWQVKNMGQPVTAQRLENGNTLVCQFTGKKVVEVDAAGKVVWEVTGLSNPYGAQRLSDGNTLIADSKGVREVDYQKKIIRWLVEGRAAVSVHRF